jgi:hypothetical protein
MSHEHARVLAPPTRPIGLTRCGDRVAKQPVFSPPARGGRTLALNRELVLWRPLQWWRCTNMSDFVRCTTQNNTTHTQHNEKTQTHLFHNVTFYGIRTQTTRVRMQRHTHKYTRTHTHTTQHNTTQHNTTQHNTTQRNTTQHNTTQHNTTQHNTTQHNTTQHNTTLQPSVYYIRERSKTRALHNLRGT